LEHEFLLQAVSVRMVELAHREEQVVEKLTHALKLQYRKIALVRIHSSCSAIQVNSFPSSMPSPDDRLCSATIRTGATASRQQRCSNSCQR